MKGNLHPITQFFRQIINIFVENGFDVFEGPEVDSEWNNFDVLNIPKDAPARDVQDTFWLLDGRVLRTHTSNCQVRYAEGKKPPIKVVIPGRVYRNEATDAKHEATFFQLEGLYIDENVKVTQLLETINKFLKSFYGNNIEFRFRPHHYAFVEPGIDVDVKLNGKWFEVLGSGMVHPKVLENMKIDPKKYSGFAFGLGIDRLAILKYNIEDIRHFHSGDLRFLKQF